MPDMKLDFNHETKSVTYLALCVFVLIIFFIVFCLAVPVFVKWAIDKWLRRIPNA